MITMAIERTSLTNKEQKSIDDVFEDIVGPAGWAQWTAFIAFGPILMLGTIPLPLNVIALYVPQHRCFVPGCDVPSNDRHSQQLDWSIANVSIPRKAVPNSLETHDNLYSSCSMYKR